MKTLLPPPGPQYRIPRWKLPKRKEILPDFLLKLARQYGDIVRFQIGKQEYYLLNHPHFIQIVLDDAQSNFIPMPPGRPDLPAQSVRLPQSAEPEAAAELAWQAVKELGDEWDQKGVIDLEISAQRLTDAIAPEAERTLPGAIAVSLYLLAHRPHIQETIAQEAKRDTLLRSARMVISESLRLFPPVPITHHRVVRDIPVGDYQIPAGTIVILSAWVTHHDPRYYPDAFAFQIQRWAPRQRSQRPLLSYFPFGSRAGDCPEEALAREMGAAALAAFSTAWRLTSLSKKIEWEASRPFPSLKVAIQKHPQKETLS